MESTVEFRRALLQVYAKRQELLDQRDALVEQAIALDRDLAEVRTNLTPYERDAAETQRAMVALDQAAARVQQQAASLLTPEDRLRAQAEFDQLRVQYATAGARLRQLNKLAAPLVARINGILTELKHRRAQAAALQVQADQLRQDWLRLVDPFGKWSRGEQERALPILNEWVVLDDGYPMAYICRGFAYHILGQTQPAMADFEKAVALEPKSPYALAARAFALNHHGDRAKARLDLELATRLGRTSDFVSVCGGLVHMQNREWRKAIADFRRACKQNPENSAAQSYLAKLLACCPEDELRDGKEAVDVATKACEATQWKGWFNLDVLSLAHAESGNFELAQEYHEKAIALVPPDARSEISQHGEAITQKMPVRLK